MDNVCDALQSNIKGIIDKHVWDECEREVLTRCYGSYRRRGENGVDLGLGTCCRTNAVASLESFNQDPKPNHSGCSGKKDIRAFHGDVMAVSRSIV